MSKSDDVSKRTLSLKKIFDAPVELVWEAWTNSDHLIHWWAPAGMKIDIIKHDFKVGGTWKYAMPMPNGNLFISEGKYLAIEPFRKIVTTADFKPMTEGVELHVEFEKDVTKQSSPSASSMQQRNIANSKRKWDFITVGDQHCHGLKTLSILLTTNNMRGFSTTHRSSSITQIPRESIH